MHCSEIGDCIGVESCAALKLDIDAQPRLGGVTSRRRRRLEATPAASKEYPPPISWLARTENLPSHMPWVMRKYYSGDGRLIIKEERVKHHDYFLADRSNGRLVLSLVHLDDAVEESCKECHAAESVVERFSGDGGDEGVRWSDGGGGGGNAECYMRWSDGGGGGGNAECYMRWSDGGGGGGNAECYKYNGIRVNPCAGFVTVAAAMVLGPPVHT